MYTHNPHGGPASLAERARQAETAAQLLQDANTQLRTALQDSAALQSALAAIAIQNKLLRHELSENTRLKAATNRAALDQKYAHTLYGGPEGLRLAAKEAAEYDRRKRTTKP